MKRTQKITPIINMSGSKALEVIAAAFGGGPPAPITTLNTQYVTNQHPTIPTILHTTLRVAPYRVSSNNATIATDTTADSRFNVDSTINPMTIVIV